MAHVVSSLGLTIAGPGAIVAREEAVLREAFRPQFTLSNDECVLNTSESPGPKQRRLQICGRLPSVDVWPAPLSVRGLKRQPQTALPVRDRLWPCNSPRLAYEVICEAKSPVLTL